MGFQDSQGIFLKLCDSFNMRARRREDTGYVCLCVYVRWLRVN